VAEVAELLRLMAAVDLVVDKLEVAVGVVAE
jgi:hypothetical protein